LMRETKLWRECFYLQRLFTTSDPLPKKRIMKLLPKL
jgi:hypothetical protein